MQNVFLPVFPFPDRFARASFCRNFNFISDVIDDLEQSLIEAKAKKQPIEAEKVTGDNIYKILIYFEKLYSCMSEEEKRQLMESLISEIQIYEERQANGQWLKSITFRLPIIEEDMQMPIGDGLDNERHVETVVLLSQQRPKDKIRVELDLAEMDITAAEQEATYREIKDYILEMHGVKVSSLYIAQIKEKYGIIERECYNKPKSENSLQPQCPPEKEKLIVEALKHFQML